MSGKPYPEGVTALSGYLRDLDMARESVARESAEVTKHQEKLDAARQNENDALNAIRDSMKKMDVSSPGNFGYEQRMLWLLRELNTQAERYGRNHP